MPVKKYFTEEDRKAARAAKQWKYNHSVKGKAHIKAYRHSDRGKIKHAVYRQSENVKTTRSARQHATTAQARSIPERNDLYIMKCDSWPDLYKVGCAADPYARARHLSAGFFDQVSVAKIYESIGKYEQEVHRALVPFMHTTPNKLKTEWFRLPYEELVEKINSIISQFEH